MSTAMRTAAVTVRRHVARVHRQLEAFARNGLLRPGPDPDYADGDDSTWMEVDWPALTRRIEVDGTLVNVVDTGGEDKPPLVFIHGLSGLWQNWLLNIPAFMDRYRCIAPDLPGFGRSEMPREEISIPGYARTVDRLCDVLGVDGPTVVGNSMGGFVGAELAQGASTPGFVPGLKANLEYSFRDKLPQIDMPTLVVWGRNDMIVPVQDALEYARLIGDNARVEIFEDTGHVPMLERPRRFNALLDAFLAGRPEPEREVGEVEGISG